MLFFNLLFSPWYWHLHLGWVRTLSWFYLLLVCFASSQPHLEGFSSHPSPHDYKAGVFKGSVLVTLLSESTPSPPEMNRTLKAPYLYSYTGERMDLSPEPYSLLLWTPGCSTSTSSPRRTQHLLSFFSNLSLILKAIAELMVLRTVSTQKPTPGTHEAFLLSSSLPCAFNW